MDQTCQVKSFFNISIFLVSQLNVTGVKFEDHVNNLVTNTFLPAGFQLIRWTKLPYLCEGDFVQVIRLTFIFSILGLLYVR